MQKLGVGYFVKLETINSIGSVRAKLATQHDRAREREQFYTFLQNWLVHLAATYTQNCHTS